MYYTIYKITNTINGKYYIGKHQTKNLEDGYMGSGRLIKAAIKKYGVENFIKEILHVFDNEQEMNQKEKELVVLSEMSYNLCEGGKGGFGYINSNPLKDVWLQKAIQKTNTGQANIDRAETVRKLMTATPEIRNRLKNHMSNRKNGMLGKKHSENAKQKMARPRGTYNNSYQNSQYGTIWITNGILNKKVSRDHLIPEGWHRGRVNLTKT